MIPDEFSKARQPAHCGTGCGKCCDVAGTDRMILMTRAEAKAISQVSGKMMVQDETPISRMGVIRGTGCPFWKDKACSVYENRPTGCRTYVCAGDPDKPHEQHPEFAEVFTHLVGDEFVADVRDWFPESFDEVIARHEKIALQFSGGKDSLATLEVMRPWWNKLTVYWLNTGDPFPEVVETVDKVRSRVPNFAEIYGDVASVMTKFGPPSDIVPYSSAEMSHILGAGKTMKLQDRFSCCFRSIMKPMHERMIADGVTLIIRGQRTAETFVGPLRSGEVQDGIEFLYPIEDWSDEQVFDYIGQCGWKTPRYYAEGMPHSGDCLTCTAWIGDGRAKYLKKYHPDAFARYYKKFLAVTATLKPVLTDLFNEGKALNEPV